MEAAGFLFYLITKFHPPGIQCLNQPLIRGEQWGRKIQWNWLRGPELRLRGVGHILKIRFKVWTSRWYQIALVRRRAFIVVGGNRIHPLIGFHKIRQPQSQNWLYRNISWKQTCVCVNIQLAVWLRLVLKSHFKNINCRNGVYDFVFVVTSDGRVWVRVRLYSGQSPTGFQPHIFS